MSAMEYSPATNARIREARVRRHTGDLSRSAYIPSIAYWIFVGAYWLK